MNTMAHSKPHFVVCVNNSDYPASLELHKIYRTVSDEDAEAEGDIRIVDESGEDYLYSQDRFVPIRVPAVVRESFTTSAGVCGRVRV
jgi:hypothetical protein